MERVKNMIHHQRNEKNPIKIIPNICEVPDYLKYYLDVLYEQNATNSSVSNKISSKTQTSEIDDKILY